MTSVATYFVIHKPSQSDTLLRMLDSTQAIRLPSDMRQAMRRLADAHERSVGAEFRLAVKEYIRRHDAESRVVEES